MLRKCMYKHTLIPLLCKRCVVERREIFIDFLLLCSRASLEDEKDAVKCKREEAKSLLNGRCREREVHWEEEPFAGPLSLSREPCQKPELYNKATHHSFDVWYQWASLPSLLSSFSSFRKRFSQVRQSWVSQSVIHFREGTRGKRDMLDMWSVVDMMMGESKTSASSTSTSAKLAGKNSTNNNLANKIKFSIDNILQDGKNSSSSSSPPPLRLDRGGSPSLSSSSPPSSSSPSSVHHNNHHSMNNSTSTGKGFSERMVSSDGGKVPPSLIWPAWLTDSRYSSSGSSDIRTSTG